jgi:hypothetical protein
MGAKFNPSLINLYKFQGDGYTNYLLPEGRRDDLLISVFDKG